MELTGFSRLLLLSLLRNTSMTIEVLKHNLVKISHYLGNNLDLAQGGGGNTSVKVNDKVMLIKASGFKLSQVSINNGFVLIDYVRYRDRLKEAVMKMSESEYSQLGIDCMIEGSKLKPSIETCFHSSLDAREIMHSHSVYANILCCSLEGKTLVKEMFPEAVFVEYATPGKNLAAKILHATKGTDTSEVIIFLQNHGIITGAASADECIELHEDVNEKIKKRFNITAGLSKSVIPVISENILFPDQAVYSTGTLESEAARETVLAANFIEKTIKKCGLTPAYLPEEESRFLLNMESEKYRQKMAFNEK